MKEKKDFPVDSEAAKQPPRPSDFSKLFLLVREKWPEYIIEILVIIVSITLSFLFDEWREKQRKAEVEQFYLKGLANDIAMDRNQLAEVAGETRQILQYTDRLINASQKPFSADTSTSLLKVIRFIMKRPRFVAEDVTFADLKSTGNMQLMTNPALKRTLFEYYNLYTSITRVEDAELDAVTTLSGPYLMGRIPIYGDRHADVDRIIADMEFRNIVFLRQSNREELLAGYQRLMKLADTIQQLVNKQLPPDKEPK